MYNEQRLVDKDAPRVEMLKVMENYKRSVDFFNSFGLDTKKKHHPETKRPLTDANT